MSGRELPPHLIGFRITVPVEVIVTPDNSPHQDDDVPVTLWTAKVVPYDGAGAIVAVNPHHDLERPVDAPLDSPASDHPPLNYKALASAAHHLLASALDHSLHVDTDETF